MFFETSDSETSMQYTLHRSHEKVTRMLLAFVALLTMHHRIFVRPRSIVDQCADTHTQRLCMRLAVHTAQESRETNWDAACLHSFRGLFDHAAMHASSYIRSSSIDRTSTNACSDDGRPRWWQLRRRRCQQVSVCIFHDTVPYVTC